MVKSLKEIADRRKELINQVDIKGLWEVLNTEQEWIDVTTMTEFCFPDNPSSDHESAVIRAFFKNRLYFKFNPDSFFPNSEEQVIRITAREKEDARKKQIITEGASWIKSVLNGNFSLSKPFTEKKAEFIADKLSSRYIKTKISDDIIGTEYAAVIKNIYAMAAGIAHGLGYGDNFQAVLMSNAIREMGRFIKKVHKMKRNINNSAYLGDLLVTGYSVFSRNRMFGNMIGKGYTVKSAMLEMSMVAEGYYATKSAYELNQKNGAKTPIIDAVYNILYSGKDAKTEFQKLTEIID
jgi:glycerol-3-phosphate dehydrogenase